MDNWYMIYSVVMFLNIISLSLFRDLLLRILMALEYQLILSCTYSYFKKFLLYPNQNTSSFIIDWNILKAHVSFNWYFMYLRTFSCLSRINERACFTLFMHLVLKSLNAKMQAREVVSTWKYVCQFYWMCIYWSYAIWKTKNNFCIQEIYNLEQALVNYGKLSVCLSIFVKFFCHAPMPPFMHCL